MLVLEYFPPTFSKSATILSVVVPRCSSPSFMTYDTAPANRDRVVRIDCPLDGRSSFLPHVHNATIKSNFARCDKPEVPNLRHRSKKSVHPVCRLVVAWASAHVSRRTDSQPTPRPTGNTRPDPQRPAPAPAPWRGFNGLCPSAPRRTRPRVVADLLTESLQSTVGLPPARRRFGKEENLRANGWTRSPSPIRLAIDSPATSAVFRSLLPHHSSIRQVDECLTAHFPSF